jgi:hypothetical protein
MIPLHYLSSNATNAGAIDEEVAAVAGDAANTVTTRAAGSIEGGGVEVQQDEIIMPAVPYTCTGAASNLIFRGDAGGTVVRSILL